MLSQGVAGMQGIAFNNNLAYITSFAGMYTQCQVGVGGIESATCFNVIPGNPGALTAPTGIAFNRNFAYIINNIELGSYTQCQVGINGIESATCNTIVTQAPGTLSNPEYIAIGH